MSIRIFITMLLTLFALHPLAAPPAAFAKIAPGSGASGLTIQPVLRWGASAGATGYEYCYDLIFNETCDSTWISAGADTSAWLTGLPTNATFYWQVRATGPGGETLANAGAWWYFTTIEPNIWELVGFDRQETYTLVVDPLTPRILYTAVRGGGVYKSSDSGMSWTAVNNGLTNLSVYTLVIDPLTPTTLYAGTYYGSGAIFKSSDGAATWTLSRAGTAPVMALGIDPQTPSTLYAATAGEGVYKSTDSGATWNPVNHGLPESLLHIKHLAVDPLQPVTLYAGTTYYGVYKSSDGGLNWAAANSGLTASEIVRLAVDPLAPATVYAVAQDGGLFKSDDGGGHWDVVSAASGYAVAYVAVAPTPPSSLYLGTIEGYIYRSRDGGGHWRQVGYDYAGMSALAFDPFTPNLLYSAGGGVYYIVTDPFAKSGPPNGARGVGVPPALTWDPGSAATAYEYCIDTSPNDNCDTAWINTGTATSAAPAGLNALTTYDWQVRAIHPGGTTYADASTWWRFTTGIRVFVPKVAR
jgi:hypothetical protein